MCVIVSFFILFNIRSSHFQKTFKSKHTHKNLWLSRVAFGYYGHGVLYVALIQIFFQCFIKCYLEAVGIWSANETINRERAIELQWADTNDDIDECLPEMMGDTECEKAYYLTRCIVTRALVDGRGHNNR